ncbi:unnamed protein product [Caenorhabditis bovis]|uniref:KANL2-like probable zinc-finger domain-containing protein n=1 Tax=Caenorhabditis bovis TaxID=2654633 RepID=A0A8S1EST2_9PELO|nr:unnamed protein product [Caenorhabditis bovis]
MLPNASISKPPGRYVLVEDTKHHLELNEYDKNTYGQCSYVSNRLMIRCQQVRSKEELAKNNGICEEHKTFGKMLKSHHQKELLRLRAESENPLSKRQKFSSFIAANGYVSDEDDVLNNMYNMPPSSADQININFIEEDPLRHAEYFTDKDVIRIRLRAVEKNRDDIVEFRKTTTAQASRVKQAINERNHKIAVFDVPQMRVYDALMQYPHKESLHLSRPKTIPDLPVCQYYDGMNDDDNTAAEKVVKSLLDRLDGISVNPPEKCTSTAIQFTDFCEQHILFSKEKQFLFDKCTICGDIALASDDPTCAYHRKDLVKVRALNPLHNVRPGEEDVQTSNHYPPGTVRNNISLHTKKVEIFDSDEEEEDKRPLPPSMLARNYENMCSPFPPLPSPSVRRPPYQAAGNNYGRRPSANREPHQTGGVLVQNRMANDAIRQLKDDPATMRCARERPFQKSNFNRPEIDKNRRKNVPTPHLLSSSGFSRTQYPSRFPQQTAQQHRIITNQGRALPGSRYSEHPHQPPKNIPLERVASPKPNVVDDEDDLVEDRGQSQPQNEYHSVHGVQYPRSMNEAPRGVPYIKKGGYQKQEGGPQAQFPQRRGVRQNIAVSRQLPMPPHRAIALGMNPAGAYPTPPANQQTRQSNLAQLASMRRPPPGQPNIIAKSPQDFGANRRFVTPSGLQLDTSKLANDPRYSNMDVKTFLQYQSGVLTDEQIANKRAGITTMRSRNAPMSRTYMGRKKQDPGNVQYVRGNPGAPGAPGTSGSSGLLVRSVSNMLPPPPPPPKPEDMLLAPPPPPPPPPPPTSSQPSAIVQSSGPTSQQQQQLAPTTVAQPPAAGLPTPLDFPVANNLGAIKSPDPITSTETSKSADTLKETQSSQIPEVPKQVETSKIGEHPKFAESTNSSEQQTQAEAPLPSDPPKALETPTLRKRKQSNLENPTPVKRAVLETPKKAGSSLKKITPTIRTPRAAAVAANQAISTAKPAESSAQAAAPTTGTDGIEMLNLLAQVCVDESGKSEPSGTPKGSPNKKTVPVQKLTPRRSTRGKATSPTQESDSHEEEL